MSTVDIKSNLNSLPGGSPNIQYDLGTIIASFLSLAILVGALLSLFFMVIAGINWVTAGGDTSKIGKARDKFIQSIIGLAVLASMWAVFLIVQYFFGINVGSSN